MNPSSNPVTGAAADGVRGDDLSVVGAAMAEFVADREAWAVRDPLRPRIVVHRRSAGPSAFLGGDQLGGEFKSGELPAEAVEEMRARNGVEVAPDESALADGRVIVFGDRDALPRRPLERIDGFRSAYPGARGYVRVWLPGYTPDGGTAVLRFSFGPTPHGATATYILKKGASGRWRVVSRKLSFYA